ncbi:hypothetical protein [Candidatus Lokiarchaeum ossiferum]|uniref:hypothetical protein n=1 Tax=Candidatus Lokiarchaeum ossiferum TaxID=2951803 RepID=UPI00352CE1A5
MEKPFLEISIASKSDTNLDDIQLLQRIKEGLIEIWTKTPESIEFTSKPSLLVTFQSLADFDAAYSHTYEVYEYLYDEILRRHIDLDENFFKEQQKLKNTTIKDEPDADYKQNYIVLRYRSNNLAPMRRNYRLIDKVNEIFGFKITNEEIQDGYLRFLKTKEDWEGMLIGCDEVAQWTEVFQLFNIDISHPTIQKFMEIIRSLK